MIFGCLDWALPSPNELRHSRVKSLFFNFLIITSQKNNSQVIVNMLKQSPNFVISKKKRSKKRSSPAHVMNANGKRGTIIGSQRVGTAFQPSRCQKNIFKPVSIQSTDYQLSLQKGQKETSRVAICSQKIFSFTSKFIP